MQNRPWEISDLLALRDGELRDASLDVHDPQVTEQLARIRQLQGELNALGDVPLDEAVWNQAATRSQARRAWLRFPLATAASVFFASVVGIYLLFGGAGADDARVAPQFTGTASIDHDGQRLAALMSQSRDLEMRLQGVDPWTHASSAAPRPSQPPASPSLTERRLMGRLADVDWQIAQLYEAPTMDSTRREALWTQRVNLLESLVAVRGGSDPRFFEDSRSM